MSGRFLWILRQMVSVQAVCVLDSCYRNTFYNHFPINCHPMVNSSTYFFPLVVLASILSFCQVKREANPTKCSTVEHFKIPVY